MKILDANVVTQLDATGKKPVLLFTLFLTGATLHYAGYKTAIAFPHGDQSFPAKAISFSGISQSLEGQIGRVSVNFDNVSKDMAAYVNSYVFEGRMLLIQRVYLDADNHAPTTATEYNEIFYGKMEQPKELGRNWVKITATEGKPLNKKVLNDIYGKECQHTFGVGQCNQDGLTDLTSLTASGTADSGTVTTLVDTEVDFAKADDYWNYGRIVIVKDSVTYERKVKSFLSNTITFDIALPVAVDNTTTYTVYKGCPKTWEACQSNEAWGPSGDNKLNFGGCIHIGIWRES